MELTLAAGNLQKTNCLILTIIHVVLIGFVYYVGLKNLFTQKEYRLLDHMKIHQSDLRLYYIATVIKTVNYTKTEI